MQAQLVWAKRPRNCRMSGQINFQRLQIADVIHAFFKAAYIPRREADPLHTQPLEFAYDEDVLGVRGRRFGFIDGDFQFKANTLRRKMPIHQRHVRDGVAVFCGGAPRGFFAHRNTLVFKVKTAISIALDRCVGR